MAKASPQILHVEDDLDLGKYIQLILTGKGEVTRVTTIEDARQLIEQQDFDLILLDLTLPDGSGMELIDPLRAKAVAPPIIIFSAHDVTDTLIGADYIFVKGHFLESDLSDAVDSLLSHPETAS
jgi:DNA-binding response OmpR family regulator